MSSAKIVKKNYVWGDMFGGTTKLTTQLNISMSSAKIVKKNYVWGDMFGGTTKLTTQLRP